MARRALLPMLLVMACENAGSVREAGPIADDRETAVWRPKPGVTWQWQLTGRVDRRVDVEAYDVDLLADDAKSTIAALHGDGRIVICYFSAGTREEWRADADDFPKSAIGNALPEWPDEQWLDVRDEGVRSVLAARLDLAKSYGCDAVEPDNVDGFDNDPGFELGAKDQLDFNRWLADESHARALSVGLKNDVDQIPALEPWFDWALNEECVANEECEKLAPLIDAGKAVFHVEYVDDRSDAADLADRICNDARARSFSTLVKTWDLDAFRIAC